MDNLNTNIEKINPHLWAVRFDWLAAGFVNIPLLPKEQINNRFASLTVDGVLVLDKNSQIFDFAKKQFIQIMRLSDLQIKKRIKKIEYQCNPQNDGQLVMLRSELTRRDLARKSKGKTKIQLETELRAVEARKGDA